MSVITLFFLKWFQTDNIYPIYDPQRWLGYIATAGLIWGSMDILIGRIRKKRQIWKFSQFSDWTLPILLILTALSGIAIHIFRYLELSLYSHFAYLIHLMIVVPLLIIEIPFGKLSHVIYRPLAIYFIKIKEKSLKLKTSEK
jgi:nitrate reductase gamma subunit